jgi:preprotein translocase subunit SecG
MLHTILLVIHVFAAVGLIGLVLLQHGKGADAGAAFGSGASQTVFGSRGSGSFLTRTTAGLAATFFATSLALAYLSGQKVERKSVAEQGQTVPPPAQTPTQAPARPPVQSPAETPPSDIPSPPQKGPADVPSAPQQ